MCGRYAAGRSTDELVEELDIGADHTRDAGADAWAPDYNVAPTAMARVALTRAPRGSDGSERGERGERGERSKESGGGEAAAPVRQLRLLRWGLVPSWSKDAKAGARMTNARAETVLEKPAFKRAARSRRCLVPADGWYEWQRSPVATDDRGRPRKQPFFMRRGDGASATFAGLYEFWKDPTVAEAPAGEAGADPWLVTFTIVTTAAEPGLDRIHDRQPLVLDPDQWAAWLDPQLDDPDVVAELLATSRPGRFEAYPVGRAVGDVRHNGPGLLEPAPAAELEGVLDPATGEIIGAPAS